MNNKTKPKPREDQRPGPTIDVIVRRLPGWRSGSGVRTSETNALRDNDEIMSFPASVPQSNHGRSRATWSTAEKEGGGLHKCGNFVFIYL